MVGYALDAELARTTFWTFSVREDQASLGSDLPMTWDQMKAPVRGQRSSQ
jgi:hypothetical protein